MSKKKIYFIVGPTASGKTALSINLAKRINSRSFLQKFLSEYFDHKYPNAEIISADSRQIYRGFDLSSGKVTKDEMENIPHHMLDIIDPGEYFSVVDFTELALEKINEVYKRGNIPIVCGGTGFYIDSLLYKQELPEAKKDDELRNFLTEKNTDELYEILLETAKKSTHPQALLSIERFQDGEFNKNKHRLMRAIEVVKQLGFFPELKKVPRFSNKNFIVKIIKTNIPRHILRKKIYKRLIERIDSGMIEEIKDVKEKYNLTWEYLEKLGLEFKWTAKYLKGEISKEEMIEKLNIETGQYAKRQDSWFRRY